MPQPGSCISARMGGDGAPVKVPHLMGGSFVRGEDEPKGKVVGASKDKVSPSRGLGWTFHL